MATGVGGAIKRAGGDAIEFAAVRQGPLGLGQAIVTPAGTLAARIVIHAVSLDRDRRTSANCHPRSRPERHGPRPREQREDDRLPGPGHGGRRLSPGRGGPDHPGGTVREELLQSPAIEVVTFALRGAAAYAAFQAAVQAVEAVATPGSDGGDRR
jgi:hypothetical protein